MEGALDLELGNLGLEPGQLLMSPVTLACQVTFIGLSSLTPRMGLLEWINFPEALSPSVPIRKCEIPPPPWMMAAEIPTGSFLSWLTLPSPVLALRLVTPSLLLRSK